MLTLCLLDIPVYVCLRFFAKRSRTLITRRFSAIVTLVEVGPVAHFMKPYFLFRYPSPKRYPDTKHNLVSFSLTALKEVEVTAALELLHGMYYSDFDNMLENVGELFVFTPGRSDYEPLEPSRKSFFFLLDKDDFSDLQVNGLI